jgi:hypothetical protein
MARPWYRNVGVDLPAGRRSAAEARNLRSRVRAGPEEPQGEVTGEGLQEDGGPSTPKGEGVAAGSR